MRFDRAPCISPARWSGRLFLGLLLVTFMVLADPTLELTDKLLKAVARNYGSEARNRLLEWQELMAGTPGADDQAKLTTVNAFFNRIPQKDDIAHWGQGNYWATPIELLVTAGGDCEDFAIAKYFTLRRLGIADEKLRISYVKAFIPAQGKILAHMVLSYYSTPDADPLILDNLNPAILPAHQRSDLVPIYGFNGAGLWRAKERGRTSNDLGRWRELLTRMQHELDDDTLGAHPP